MGLVERGSEVGGEERLRGAEGWRGLGDAVSSWRGGMELSELVVDGRLVSGGKAGRSCLVGVGMGGGAWGGGWLVSGVERWEEKETA